MPPDGWKCPCCGWTKPEVSYTSFSSDPVIEWPAWSFTNCTSLITYQVSWGELCRRWWEHLVERFVFGVWVLEPLWAVKSVRVMRGCGVRFVPRWKRGRWKSKR